MINQTRTSNPQSDVIEYENLAVQLKRKDAHLDSSHFYDTGQSTTCNGLWAFSPFNFNHKGEKARDLEMSGKACVLNACPILPRKHSPHSQLNWSNHLNRELLFNAAIQTEWNYRDCQLKLHTQLLMIVKFIALHKASFKGPQGFDCIGLRYALTVNVNLKTVLTLFDSLQDLLYCKCAWQSHSAICMSKCCVQIWNSTMSSSTIPKKQVGIWHLVFQRREQQ